MTGYRTLDPEPILAWIRPRLAEGIFAGSGRGCPRFAETFGISYPTYTRWRAGRNVRPHTLEKLADHCGVHPSEIHPRYWESVA